MTGREGRVFLRNCDKRRMPEPPAPRCNAGAAATRLPGGKEIEFPDVIAKRAVMRPGIADFGHSKAQHVHAHESSQTANRYALASSKAWLLQFSPGHPGVVKGPDFEGNAASGVRNHAQRSEQLVAQFGIGHGNPAAHQFVEYGALSGLIERWSAFQR